MNKRLKTAIKAGFGAPAPEKKTVFIAEINSNPPAGETGIRNFGSFVLAQTAYIRKWVWGLSLGVFAVVLAGAKGRSKDMLGYTSACMPLLALAVVAESGRSRIYGMDELEQAARFSLRSVILAKLAILGIADFILLSLLLPLALTNNHSTILQAGVYMVCPYLLTVFTGLCAVRRMRGSEAVYICMGIAACISFMVLISYQLMPAVYEINFLPRWMALLAASVAGVVIQFYKALYQQEESWSLL